MTLPELEKILSTFDHKIVGMYGGVEGKEGQFWDVWVDPIGKESSVKDRAIKS